MHLSSMHSSSKEFHPRFVCLWAVAFVTASAFLLGVSPAQAAKVEREPIRLRVVAVNPSATKTQQVPVKFYLPQELTPREILDLGELQAEYDDQKSGYFVYKNDVVLAPRETKIFEVFVKDVWLVGQPELDGLKTQTSLVLSRLEKTPYFQTAKPIGDSIFQRLASIQETQNDEALSRKEHIGVYRLNTQALAKIKEDLNQMEKLLSFTGGPPIPQMLEESKLKSDSPSTKTTWMLIFLIVIFLGLLGAMFFFTWHRRAKDTQDFSHIKQLAFPESHQPAGSGNVPPSTGIKGKAA